LLCAGSSLSWLPAGCVQFGGHRIAGLSGTYVQQHYQWGHHERLPYDEKAIKSIYHVRQQEVHKLMQVGGSWGGGAKGRGGGGAGALGQVFGSPMGKVTGADERWRQARDVC